MKRVLACLILLVFASSAHSEQVTSIGWYNDANHTDARHGCWNGPGQYLACYNWDEWSWGWWGTGEAWLWIYSDDGIQDIDFAVFFAARFIGYPRCLELAEITQEWNSAIVAAAQGALPAQPLHRNLSMQASFSACPTGWFWVYKAAYWRREGWEIGISSTDDNGIATTIATLCDENGTRRSMSIIPPFILRPLSSECDNSPISTESNSWGAIKALYE